mmetsp:Transcript_88035/g.233729  ORF Transcript_88035/g.233729 Transcript_88035/m.233729 type:complete len:215 (-) Transcript_88035:414-1058(-)
MVWARACKEAESLPGSALAPVSTKAWATALKTVAEDGTHWFCSSRTKCQVSRPSTTERPRSFRRASGRAWLAFTCRVRRTACSFMTAATSAMERSFGWKSVRCFCLAANAVSASSAGEIARAAAVAMSFRPKDATMASTRWRCTSLADTFRWSNTSRSAERSPSLSGLWQSTHRTTFDSARRPRAPLPDSSRAADNSLNGKRSTFPHACPTVAG